MDRVIDRNEVFDQLMVIRDSGVVNMFGAGPVLAQLYHYDQRVARKLLADWIETCKDGESATWRKRFVEKV